jgi:hypothetical protein
VSNSGHHAVPCAWLPLPSRSLLGQENKLNPPRTPTPPEDIRRSGAAGTDQSASEDKLPVDSNRSRRQRPTGRDTFLRI